MNIVRDCESTAYNQINKALNIQTPKYIYPHVVKKKCTCTNGTPTSGADCPKDGASRCQGCKDGFALNADKTACLNTAPTLATVYLLYPTGNSAGHSHTSNDIPNRVDPAKGWVRTGETYVEANTIPREIWKKDISGPYQLYHTTHLGWGYVYLVQLKGKAKGLNVAKSHTSSACGPDTIKPPMKPSTKVNCDRNYAFGRGFKAFFGKYGSDMYLIQHAHDPNDASWKDKKLAMITPTMTVEPGTN